MADPKAMTLEEVRSTLTGESAGLARRQRAFRRIPSPPRCKLCAAPFAGVGGLVLRPAGFKRSPGNPALCTKCVTELRKRGMSGVEIPVTLLFSDVRGSTAMGERLRPTEFHEFLDRFYRLASDAVLAHDGLIDKVVGDEIVALFFGGSAGRTTPEPQWQPQASWPSGRHAQTLRRRGRSRWELPSTRARPFVGATGPAGTIEDFTALGDVVNTTARLASAARAGEVIVSVAAAEAAGVDSADRRTLEIRGREEPVEVVVLRPAEAEISASS